MDDSAGGKMAGCRVAVCGNAELRHGIERA